MLIPLPSLFSPEYVMPDEQLAHMDAVAQRQSKLMRRVFWGTSGLTALAFSPYLSGPGPLLTWAAGRWPELFGVLYRLALLPMSRAELLGSLSILTVFVGVYLCETRRLAEFQENLGRVEGSSSMHDALNRLSAGSEPVKRYLDAVARVRALRMGDWQVARMLSSAHEGGGPKHMLKR